MAKDAVDRKLEDLASDPNEQLDAAMRTRVLDRIASAPFSADEKKVGEWSRLGANYDGQPNPSVPGETVTDDTVLDAAGWHALKHIAQGEWQPGTTTQEYRSDVRAAVLHPAAALHVGREKISYRGSLATTQRSRAAVRVDMAKAKSVTRKAAAMPGTAMLAIYAIDTRRLATAYQLEAKKAMATVTAWADHRSF
ncbi:MAG: hypothetical protein ACRELY_22430 [Polyangiaceae bacterium]